MEGEREPRTLAEIDSESIAIEDGDVDIENSLPASNIAERSVQDAAKSSQSLKPDIVFLGAGPVGLWTAVQTKILVPSAEIVMVEKYQVYQRSHVLRLDKSSFKHCVRENQELNTLVESWPKFIRTNDMEDGLLKLAQKLGIKFLFQAIRDGQELVKLFPSTRAIVGSDGSHSIIRHSMFGNELSVQKDIQMTAEVKYEVEGTTTSLNYISQTYPCLKLMHYVATESIGKPKNGKTPVTLRLLIDSEAHSTVRDASFKNPFYFPTHGHLLHPKLKSAINIWLNAKETFVNEKRVPGSEKLTALKLSVYRARKFHCVLVHPGANNIDVFLVGDSAFGVPFFRALNNGFLCGSHLAFTLAKLVDSSKKNNLTVIGNFLQKASRATQVGSFMMDKLQLSLSKVGHKVFFETDPDGYNNYVSAMADAEIMAAEGKKTALKLFKMGNEINGAVPWQVLRFSSEVEQKLKQDVQFSAPLVANQKT